LASLNKVMLIGNAGKDAELRYLASGMAKAEFSLAVNGRRRGQSGDWEEQTEWFNIVMFAETAERVSQYITKGKSVYVEGRLQTRSWDDDQGARHYRTEVIVNTLQLLGGRGGDEGGAGGGGGWGDGESSFAGRRGGGGQAGGGGTRSSYSGGPRGGGAPGAAGSGGGGYPSDPDDLPFE